MGNQHILSPETDIMGGTLLPGGISGRVNPLNPRFWERWILPGGGPQRPPPLEINEGVSGEQDSLNTIFNTHKIRIVCKI